MRLVIISGLSGSGKSVALHLLEDVGLLLHRQRSRGVARLDHLPDRRHGGRVLRQPGRRRRCAQPRQRPRITARAHRAVSRPGHPLRDRLPARRRRQPPQALRREPAPPSAVRPGHEPAGGDRPGKGAARAGHRLRRAHHRHQPHQHLPAARRGAGPGRPAHGRRGCRFSSSRSVTSTAFRSMPTSSSTCAACRIHTGRRACGRSRAAILRSSSTWKATKTCGRCTATSAAFLDHWIPKYVDFHRNYLTIALGCTGGQHRSVYMAEKIAASTFAKVSRRVLIRHNELRGIGRPLDSEPPPHAPTAGLK